MHVNDAVTFTRQSQETDLLVVENKTMLPKKRRASCCERVLDNVRRFSARAAAFLLSLRFIVVSVVILAAVVSTTVAFVPLYRSAVSSSNELGWQYMAAASETVSTTVLRFLSEAQSAYDVVVAGPQSDTATNTMAEDPQRITGWLRSGVVYGAGLVGLIFDLPGSIWTGSTVSPDFMEAPDGLFYVVRYNASGGDVMLCNTTTLEVVNVSYTTPAAPFRTRRYYPIFRQRRAWDVPFVGIVLGRNETVLPAGGPLRAQNGTTVGAAYIRNRASKIVTHFLGLKIATNGRAMIVDAVSGYLIASNNADDDTITRNTTTNTFQVSTLNDVSDALLSRTVTTQGSALLSCPTPCNLAFDRDGEDIYVTVMSLSDAHGLELRLIVVVPSGDFLDTLRGSIRVSVIAATVSVSCIVIASAVAMVFALRPLTRVEDRLVASSTLDGLDEPSEAYSMITEIHHIETSFEKLRQELRKMKAFLPQSLLEMVENSSQDEDIMLAPSHDAPRQSSLCETLSEGLPTADNNGNNSTDESTAVAPSAKRKKRLGGAIHKSLNMECVLATKRVTVLMGNVLDFHELASRLGPIELRRVHGELVARVLSTAKHSAGVVDHVLGDHFYLSWNVSSYTRAHVIGAATFVQQLMAHAHECELFLLHKQMLQARLQPIESPPTDAVHEISALSMRTANVSIPMTFGIATGTALCGNFGCDGLMAPSIIGSPVHQAFVLMHQCKTEKVACLLNADAASVLKDCGRSAVVHWNYVRLPHDQRPSLISALIPNVEGVQPSEDDVMWRMYVNRGFESFVKGNVDVAGACLKRVPESQWIRDGLRNALLSQ